MDEHTGLLAMANTPNVTPLRASRGLIVALCIVLKEPQPA